MKWECVINAMSKIDKILSMENNEANFREIKKKVNNKLIPFIGAGISMSYGYKGWEGFLLYILDEYIIDESIKNKIRQQIIEQKYYDAAENIDKELNYGLNEIIRITYEPTTLHNKNLNQGVLPILSKFNSKLIITTNYDCLIEEIYKAYNIHLTPLKLSSYVINNFIKENKNNCILKLHGDIDDFNSLVFTKNQYEKFYGGIETINDEYEIPKAISVIWRTCTMLFLGCSLDNDITVKKMKTLAGSDSENYHYAIVELPADEKKKKIKNNQLLTLKIRPIWYPTGHHEYIEIIMNELLNGQDIKIATTVCPNCGSISYHDSICDICKKRIALKTYSEVMLLTMEEVNKYITYYRKVMERGKKDSEIYYAIGLCYLRIEDFQKAFINFEKVEGIQKADALFYAAICLLKGKKAFLTPRSEIDKIEKYLNQAIHLNGNATYYYFMAYIKYDYYKRKSFRTEPTYQDLISVAYDKGLTDQDIHTMFLALRVQRPNEI